MMWMADRWLHLLLWVLFSLWIYREIIAAFFYIHLFLNNMLLHCGIYGQVGIIFFNNIPCQFPLRFIILINYHTRTAVLVLWLLVILLHPCVQGKDCCTAVRSVQRCQQCSSVTARVTAAVSQNGMLLHRAPPSLQLLILAGRVGDWLQWCMEQWLYVTPLMWLLTHLRWMTVYSFVTNYWTLRMSHLLSHVTSSWPLCDWWVSETHQRVRVSDYQCSACRLGCLVSGLWHSHV